MSTVRRLNAKKPKSTANYIPLTVDHNPNECMHTIGGKPIHHKTKRAIEDKNVVENYEIDGTKRDIIIPNVRPNDLPIMFPMSEYKRLKKQSHVVPLSEKIQIVKDAEEQKVKLQMESQARKDQLLKAQIQQQSLPGSTLDKVETEAASKNTYLLKRSKDLITEQDERVKQANALILANKCRAIRNLQIVEKEIMKKQLHSEEQRLDTMMEQRRQELIIQEEKKKELKKHGYDRYRSEIKEQIDYIEIEKILKAQRLDEETRAMNKALIVLQKEEEEKMIQRREKQKEIRDDFIKSNAEAERYKNLQLEEERIADLRVREFMKQKFEREEALANEAKLVKLAKEKEIERLKNLREKAQDRQLAMSEIDSLRRQEEKEREWRQKELAAAKKHKEMIENLKKARRQQIEDIRQSQARVLAKDEEDFKKVAKIQREIYEKDLAEKDKKKMMISKHRKELLAQINEKERRRIHEMHEKYEEGKAQRLECELKDRNVEDYIKQKINSLRNFRGHKLPDDYIKEIERQLKISQ